MLAVDASAKADAGDYFKELPWPPRGSTLVVGMSGGVDSSLVALLMAERGCTVVGATMRVYDGSGRFPPGTGNGCYGPGKAPDEAACSALCGSIGAGYEVVDLSEKYNREILSNFTAEYRRGRTPNPCLRCNPLLKFGLLPQILRQRGVNFDYYVTGHYARLVAAGGEAGRAVYLAPALDPAKDQSYFLQRLPQEALAFSRFPLGSLTKQEVRELARSKGLVSADRKDSQDFIAPEDYGILFGDPSVPGGQIRSACGAVLGTHRGIHHYTVGQRRGLGVSTGTEPLYVLALDAERDQVIVGAEEQLYSRALEASAAVWAPGFGGRPFRAWVKIRLASTPVAGLVSPGPDGRVRVEFDTAVRAVAPGQSAAFYVSLPGKAGALPAQAAADRRVLEHSLLAGGAIIDRAVPQEIPARREP